MYPPSGESLAQVLLSEISVIEALSQSRLKHALPKGMEVSHFCVLNHFAKRGGEETPAQLAQRFHVTKGAMTNTLARLEKAGYVSIRPDWDDGRRKQVSINEEGVAACNEALRKVEPLLDDLSKDIGDERIRAAIPLLRQLRTHFENDA